MVSKNIYRIHHIRPRFKGEVESVLAFMASEITNIGEVGRSEFRDKMNLAIKFYPGNASLAEKTINNWRTEISSLFGLVIDNGVTVKPSNLSKQLASSGDLIQFFRNFLYHFQYPGGHLKPKEIANFIKEGIKFKPAHYLLALLVYGTTKSKNRFGISKAEATHLILNNLSVTRDNLSFQSVFDQILRNRKLDKQYITDGDIVRYAGDILDYLTLADLVDKKLDGNYYPQMHNLDVIEQFRGEPNFFLGFDSFYGLKKIDLQDINATIVEWQEHVGEPHNGFNSSVQSMGISNKVSIAAQHSQTGSKTVVTTRTNELDARLKQLFQEKITTLDIGNFGEAIAIQHEKLRITKCGGEDEIHKIVKIPEQYAAGYDIRSLLGEDGDFTHIHIEVKSTISKNKLSKNSFNLTPNEYNAALSHQDRYYIYRIYITPTDLSLFVIKNPVKKMKDDELQMNASSSGNTFRFNELSGEWQELLL